MSNSTEKIGVIKKISEYSINVLEKAINSKKFKQYATRNKFGFSGALGSGDVWACIGAASLLGIIVLCPVAIGGLLYLVATGK